MSNRRHDSAARRRLAAALTGAVLLGGLGVVGATQFDGARLTNACGVGGELVDASDDGYVSCVHRDPTPPGINLAASVSTGALLAREGVGPNAAEAASDFGVPATPASVAVTPDVACDGDGSAGYRVEALYVVEAGGTNRYAALKPTMQNWAAGIDDVFNKSAAITGGVRHLRYVTETAGGGRCVISIDNVTVPTGSLRTFSASMNALAAAGYDDVHRKYLVWADIANQGICGIASMWNDETGAQSNINNGLRTQFARIDNPCWGLGNGTNQSSIEAHELMHTLGGVQGSAPNSSQYGHCTDESDTMCYVDHTGVRMRQICPADHEYLLDCGSNDYYSTSPDSGNWLSTHWNAADSRFLIGGGNGADGGSVGTPTTLGAKLAVNNPAVPGLATQVAVTPMLPTGRTVAGVAWKSAKADCVFADRTALQTTVTCSAVNVKPTTVTVTITDSTGANRTVTSPLTFATGTARPVSIALSVDHQGAGDVSSASMCLGASTPVRAVVTDTATGLPVVGLSVAFTKKLTTATAKAARIASVLSVADGIATSLQTPTAAAEYGAGSMKNTVYAASEPAVLPATVEKCTPELAATAAASSTYLGDPIRITGTLDRAVGSATVPVAKATLTATVTTTTTTGTRTVTKVAKVGTATTAADGSYVIDAKVVTDGVLTVALTDSRSFAGTTVDLGDVTAVAPTTTLTGALDKTDVGLGGTVIATGRLTRVAATTTGAAAQAVALVVTVAGKPVTLGTARTAVDGSYKIAAAAKAAGDYRVAYAGAGFLPAAAKELGTVTFGTWTTALTGAPSVTSVVAGKPVTISGTLSRSYGGTTEPAAGYKLEVTATPAVGAPTVVKVTVSATGTYTLRVTPKLTTTYAIVAPPVTGYDGTSLSPFTVTVT
ncbi:hypothetical protein [Nocardioides sp. URHA0020]|uniref:hypothetical protein n=1 Tax=Nocardioides sp. URHA0020 TaxID=1380392 RepID=UPI0006866AE8|nr:hypothetical protein [Nocardioides sp. URHA0020]